MPNRHALRIIALQVLFQLDAQGEDFESQVQEYVAQQQLDAQSTEFVCDLVHQTWSHRTEIDPLIQGVCRHWDLNRLTAVDLNILRLAAGELMHQRESPYKVVINEAIELAKQFGTAESPQFVNGILDALWKKCQPAD
jgi:N utilization substance protein B